jgi:Zn-dependent protease
MIKPAFLEPEDRPTIVGQVFGTPMVVKGWTGLPLIELVLWGILSWVAGRKRPDWSWRKRTCAGAVTTFVMLGSEWCHNLAHTAVAFMIGRPVDAIRIFWGTPLLIYYDINDQKVTPRQHMLRALGGPVFNALMVPLAWLAKHFTREGSLFRYAADFALGTNIVLSTVSLLPIPGIDGGPLLKWSLVDRGHSPEEADEVLKGVNRLVGGGLAVASGVALNKRRKWLAVALAAFAATSLAIGFGLLKEQKLSDKEI